MSTLVERDEQEQAVLRALREAPAYAEPERGFTAIQLFGFARSHPDEWSIKLARAAAERLVKRGVLTVIPGGRDGPRGLSPRRYQLS